MTTSIFLNHVRFHAHHGVFDQERLTGGDFIVDLRLGYDFSEAMLSDNLEQTLNYAAVYDVLRREMEQPSALLERVAGRIVEAIGREFPQVKDLHLRLTKVNPPMGADCDGAGVEVDYDYRHDSIPS